MFKLSTTALIAATILAVMAPVRTAPLIAVRHEGHNHGNAAPANAGSLVKENALQAQQLNAKFSSVKATDSCQGA